MAPLLAHNLQMQPQTQVAVVVAKAIVAQAEKVLQVDLGLYVFVMLIHMILQFQQLDLPL